MALTPGDSTYTVLRVLHILGAMLFLGGLATGIFWKVGADRSNNAPFAARVHRRLRRADGWIIVPSAFVTFAAGYAMIRFFGSRIGAHPVALAGLILMFTALAAWYFGMRPLAAKLATEAEACEKNGQPLSVEYGKRSFAWVALALFANALVVLVAVLMILKPPMH